MKNIAIGARCDDETNPSASSELGVESFDRLLKGFQTQLAGFRTEDTVLIGNCPQNVSDEEINKFFCGFATIVKLQRVVFKSLTTNVFIAKFDSTESASRSKVLNTLALNGKKILLLQPDEKHFFNKKNVVELNGLQEHSEEVIYDHMSTFGNVSFVLKTNTVTYIVFEELSAVESSCRCDYLDQYPVTIRSVLDCPAAGAGGQGSSIETCILEQIDQNSSLLADEDEGQINNFMNLLDMENLDEYLEQDEKEKSSTSDKPLLEVGNEEIIVTEDEAARSEGDKEADVAAIEKQALQPHQVQRAKTAGTVLVDSRAKGILKLSSNLLYLTDLPQLNVAVRRVPNKVKIRPKKGALPSKHVESKKKKKKSAAPDSSVSKKVLEASSDHGKKQEESDKSKARKTESSVEKKKTNKKEPFSGKEVVKSDVKSDKEVSKKKQTKKENPVPVTEQTQKKPAGSTINENKSETKSEVRETKSSDKKKDEEHEANANIVEHKQKAEQSKQQKKGKVAKDSEKVKGSDSKPEVSESTTKKAKAIKEEKETNRHPESEILQTRKSVFVQLTKLTSKQIQELSQIRREPVTSHSVVEGDVPKKVKQRKPGPAKGAMKEKPVHLDTPKKAAKRGLSDDELESPTSLVAEVDAKPTVATSPEKPTETESTQKKKKPKLEKSPEKVELVNPDKHEPAEQQTETSTDEGKSEAHDDSEQKPSDTTTVEDPNAKPEQTVDEPVVLPESTSEVAEISDSVPDLSNVVEIFQIESAADMESEEERPLVMDISFDLTEEIIGKQYPEEEKPDRKVVMLDSKSAALLKGKTHDGHLLFVDVLPRVAVKIRQITAADYDIPRPKEHHKPSSGHHEKHPPKKVSFDSSAVKRKEDKPEKPRKTNLDRIDSKFLPAGSKLKSKVKSKTEINHKKHLPVPELPIELKTHLNTSFKIPKKNSNVKPQSIDRNASELNCLHKEREDERDKQRKRFQKERRPRDGPGGRDRKQNRPEPPAVRQEQREPSPVPDFFDPSFDDGSPSPQRIQPTPPPATETPAAAPPQAPQRDGNRRPPVNNRGNNKPSFQEIWNIPEKKPEVWAKPPWGSSAAGPTTIGAGDTWDAEPVQPVRERNINTRPNITRDIRENRSQVAGAPQSRNTIDSGESWSPGGAAPQQKSERPQPSRTIDDGESWSPGTNKRDQQPPQRDLRQDRHPPPQFSARRSRSPHQVQLTNTISGGDMWDLDGPPLASARKLPSPKRTVNQNPLLSGDTWDDDDGLFDEPTEAASPAQFDRRPSIEQQRRPSNRISPMRNPPEQRRRSRSPIHQRRSRSRSPPRRRSSMDRSLNRSVNQSPDRRNVERSRSRDQRSQSPFSRQQSLDGRPNRPLDRRNLDRDQSPFGRRHGNFDRSPLRGSPNRMPFRPGRSCSPGPGLALSPSNIWDVGTSSRTNVPPKRNMSENTLLAGGTWDEEIVPLRGLAERSPPRLRESLLDQRRGYALDRLSPNGRRRSGSRDRLPPERRNQSFDRSSLRREGDNRRWSRDRSPNRRKRSRSRSPGGWRRSMERSPVRRRRSVGDRSPSYQRMLDYWKAVEDQEGENDFSSDRPNMERHNEFRSSPSPDRWESRANDRDFANRDSTGRIDRDMPWANEPKPRYQAMDDSQYSPSRAFDAISSDEECDFTNPRRAVKKSALPARESIETIPLKIPSRTQPPIVPLDELPFATTSPIADHGASRDSLDSIPSYNGEEAAVQKANEVARPKEQPIDEALSPHSELSTDEKKSVLENLKQRAERLKKLEEMKLARQKLLAQIKHHNQPSEVEMSKPNQPSEKSADDEQKHPDRQVLVATATVPAANVQPSKVDSPLKKPPLPASGIPVHLPQIPPLPVCPPLPFGFAPPVPPLPSEAPPPPPPEEPRPPEPANFVDTMVPPPSNAWNPPPPSFAAAPMPHIDVSQPPPHLANPLLNPLKSPQYESDGEEPFDDRSNTFNPQFPPAHFIDKFRKSQPNRGQNFNMPQEDNPFQRMPSEENDFINPGMLDFNEPNNQQLHRDPRQQQQQQQHNRFGGNRQFMRPQQQPQQQQKRDPRQTHDGDVYGAGQFNRNNNPGNNFNNNNRGNNFNNRPGNNFNNNRGNNFRNNNFNNNPDDNFNNNPGNNFNNNNRGNNFSNNNPGNNFRNNNNPDDNFNNNPGNNFNNNNRGNNFNNNNPGNNFRNNPGNNFNNNPGNNFRNNNRGNNFNNIPGDNFNNMPDDNFNNPENIFFNNNPGNPFNDNPGNNFNNNNLGNFFTNNRGGRGGGRGRFSNNQQQQQRFNFQQQNRNPRLFNNNRNNQQQQQQQPRFLMQEEEMFDESCFDMNAVDVNDGGDANEWDDLE